MDAVISRAPDPNHPTTVQLEPPRLRRPDRQQTFFEPVNLDERLPADHRARVVWAVVGKLELTKFSAALVNRGSTPGRSATDPALLVALWLYATIDNVGSARRLARLCTAHDAYRRLCGGVSVNYHTLSDFRVQHQAALDELFTQVITALVSQDLVTVKRLSQDGMRVRAGADLSPAGRTAETVNGEVRTYRGLGAFLVRGLGKVRCAALWSALAYNLVHFGEELMQT